MKEEFSDAQIAEIIYIMNASTTAWRIMSDMWKRLCTLSAEYPNNKDLKSATDHAWDAFQQEINGMRDHLKELI